MFIPLADAYVLDGPLYEGPMTEDGDTPAYYDTFVVAVAQDGRKFTWKELFDTKADAEAFAAGVRAQGYIVHTHTDLWASDWGEGTPWDYITEEPWDYETERAFYEERGL